MPSVVREVLLGAFLLAALVAMRAARADEVTIYRCVDSKGGVALQDSPCPKDAHQEVRQMLRPLDAPSRPQSIAVAQPAQRSPQPRPVRNPQPLYQCTSPNGDSYMSQSGIPQGSYAPLWTTGYGNGYVGAGARTRPQQTNGTGQFRGGVSGQSGSSPYPYGAYTYVQDTCVRMAQDQVCEALRDRDSELGTKIFNAQPDDRAVYEREQNGLRTQLRNDCGAN